MNDISMRRALRGAGVGLGTAAVVLASAAAPLGALAAETGDQVNIQAFNDFHGALGGADDENVNAGEALACTITQERAEHPDSMLLSSGDNVGGSSFASAVQNDEPTIDYLNALGVDATAIGNHEYDQGASDLLERIEPRTDFPDLAANVYRNGERLHDPYAVIEAGDVRVAVIGAVTTKTTSKVSPAAIEGLEFRDPVDEVNAAYDELVASGEEFDVVVASYHEGASGSAAQTGQAPENTDPIFDKIVESTDGEIDAIFNGDSHQVYAYTAPVPGQSGEVRPIVQTGASAANLGSVTLQLGADGDWDLAADGLEMIPVVTANRDLSGCVGDPVYDAAAAVVVEAVEQAAVVGAEPVGTITDDITTSWNDTRAQYVDGVRVPLAPVGNQATTKGDDRTRHSAAGNVLADSMKWYLEQRGTNEGEEIIGFMNPGGIRAELWDAAAGAEGEGVVTYAEANNVVPFGNTLNSGEVTGAQFKQMLEEQWVRTEDGTPDGRFLAFSVSENVQYVIDSSRDQDDRVVQILINGEPIDPQGTYTIVTASFLFEGGDGQFALSGAQNVSDTGVLDRDAFVEFLGANEGLAPDYSQRQVDVQYSVTPSGFPNLTVGRLASFSLGAPEITSVVLDAGERGTLEVPFGKNAAGVYQAAFPLDRESFCLEAGESASLTLTTVPDTGTAVQVDLVGTAATECGEVAFVDVPEDLQFHDEITWMGEQGYARGWEDGTYRPFESVNRDAMAAFLYRMAGEPEVTEPRTQPFTDVTPGDEHYEAIIWAYQQGITQGYPDRTFRPTQPIARDAMAAFLYRYAGSPDVAPVGTPPFSDIPATSQFADEIQWMKDQGITTGYEDGTYGWSRPVLRDAMAAFLFRLENEQQIAFMSQAD